MKALKIIIILFMIVFYSCSPLNPINDFFGIRMNPTDEQYFRIVGYNDIDGISYKNSLNMDPKINGWAEFEPNRIVIKITNNSNQDIPLHFTSDQFIIISKGTEYYLGKGEREEYIKKNYISSNNSETFYLDYPNNFDYLSLEGRSYVDQTKITRDLIRNYSRTDGMIQLTKKDIDYFIIKLGDVSLVLKQIPQK